MNQILTMLMSRAGERISAKPSEGQATLPIMAQGGGHHADSTNGMEHWNVVYCSCDRRGARCLWCLAGLGSRRHRKSSVLQRRVRGVQQ